MDARRRRGGSSGSSESTEDEYVRDGAVDRGECSGSAGMQWDVVAILAGRGRDIVNVVDRRRSIRCYRVLRIGNVLLELVS